MEESYHWKDSVQPPEEIRVWVADGVAHGLRPWFAKFNGKLIDRRWPGWYQALVEARIPFEMVHDRMLDGVAQRGLRTLILPNIAALSDLQCEPLQRDHGLLLANAVACAPIP